MSRSIDARQWAGTDARSQPWVVTLLAGRLDGWRGPDLDGIERIWRVADVPLAGWKVLVGLDAARLLAPARAELLRNALVIALLLLLVGALATGIGRAIAQPVRAQARQGCRG